AGPGRRRGGRGSAKCARQPHRRSKHPPKLGQYRSAAPRAGAVFAALAPAGALGARAPRRPGAARRRAGRLRQLGPLARAAFALSGAGHAGHRLAYAGVSAGALFGSSSG
nr:hypothetical protein [Tanacetum cinerariifolium]